MATRPVSSWFAHRAEPAAVVSRKSMLRTGTSCNTKAATPKLIKWIRQVLLALWAAYVV